MKVLAHITTLMFALAVFPAIGQMEVVSKSEVIEPSIVIDEENSRISFFSRHSFGGNDYHEFDFGSGRWMTITDDGDLIGGEISKHAMDDYALHGFQIPCFTSPWAFAGCIVLIGIGDQVCQSRAEANIRQAQSQCGPGEVAEITSITGCGNVTFAGCRAIDPENGFGSAIDPDNDFGINLMDP